MRTIAIGLLMIAFASGAATAQTAGEQAQIVRDFEQSLADYTQRHACLDAIHVTAPAPKIFTLPVAMVFRQRIARALAAGDGVAAINGPGAYPHAHALKPFPANYLYDFPPVLADALPQLPPPLEYRLVGVDLVIRDKDGDIVIGVLRNAVGPALGFIR